MTPDFLIEGDPIALRPYCEDDFATIAALMGDAEITRYISWGPRDRAAARAAFDSRLAADVTALNGALYPFALVDVATGRVAGEAMLLNMDWPNRGGELGFMLHPDFRGRGFAGYAVAALLRFGFERLGLHRIHGTCDDGNAASARVMQKAGLRQEAHFRRHEFMKGAWRGLMVFAVLEEEWWASSCAGAGASP